MSRPKRPALGRGLGALIPESPRRGDDRPTAQDDAKRSAPVGDPARPFAPRTMPIERLEPNPEQPRKHFDPTALRELSESVRNQGMIQPIVVVPLRGRDTYQILAGERRWRAAQMAGLHEVPVVVRDTPDDERLELALVENIQRADLNPIEEARAYEQLVDLRGMTQEEVAGRVGKDRSTVSNAIRLLRLPEKVQAMVIEGQLSMGHARALLSLPSGAEMTELAREIVARKLSVRAAEAAVRKRLKGEEDDDADDDVSDEIRRHRIIVRDLEDRLRQRLGLPVSLKTGDNPRGPGRLEMRYSNLDELNGLLNRLLDDGHE